VAALFGGRLGLSDRHIHQHGAFGHSIDVMLVLPASMASSRVVPLAHHVELKSCTHCTRASCITSDSQPPFFSRNGAASFLYGKETPFLSIPGRVLLPARRAARKWLPSCSRRRVPPARSKHVVAVERGGAGR
jgi:hypothetical protein